MMGTVDSILSLLLSFYDGYCGFYAVFIILPEGRPGMSDLSSCLESQDCHLIPLSYVLSCLFFVFVLFFLPSPLVLFCLVIFLLMVHFPDFFFLHKTQIFFVKG